MQSPRRAGALESRANADSTDGDWGRTIPGQRVSRTSRNDASLLTESNNPRDTFAGHVRSTPWDQLQRLYFLGYAMWNYLCTPFLFNLPGFHCRELAPHEEQNQTWRVLEVTYPPEFPAHCPVQKLYFDTSGLLKRLDYQTEIAGGIASHYCFDPTVFDGLLFYTRRRVVRRTAEGPDLSGPPTISLEFGPVAISNYP